MPKAKTYKPTRADFAAFRQECSRCLRLLEMGEWRIIYRFLPLGTDTFATLAWDSEGHLATITLNSDRFEGDDADDFDAKRSGRHEAAHLFVARLEDVGRMRYIIPDMFSVESERIARTLEKIL